MNIHLFCTARQNLLGRLLMAPIPASPGKPHRSAPGFLLSLALPHVLPRPPPSQPGCLPPAGPDLPPGCFLCQKPWHHSPLSPSLLGQPFLTHQVQGTFLGAAASVAVPRHPLSHSLHFSLPSRLITNSCVIFVFSTGLRGTRGPRLQLSRSWAQPPSGSVWNKLSPS